MSEFNLIEDLSEKIKDILDDTSNKRNVCLIYAFNGTGKTRLSKIITDVSEEKTLAYDAFFEDLFTWDNETYTLRFNSYSKIIKFIRDQGLENQIVDNFQKLIGSKIEPNFDFTNGKIIFNFTPGDERRINNIKISRGEESLFIWSIYYTVLDTIISILNVSVEERETDEFNNLEYIIIDDPVSSVDETRIITMAVELIELIQTVEKNNLKFLITTHHPLFYNIIFNEFSKKKGYTTTSYLLSKLNVGLRLDQQKDTPFGYHLLVKDKIQEAIATNNIEKYHFNLFRALLEKTSTYLGYNNWYDCIESDKKKEISKLINMYSHGKLSDLESKHFPEEHKELFRHVFEDFIERYKWKI